MVSQLYIFFLFCIYFFVATHICILYRYLFQTQCEICSCDLISIYSLFFLVVDRILLFCCPNLFYDLSIENLVFPNFIIVVSSYPMSALFVHDDSTTSDSVNMHTKIHIRHFFLLRPIDSLLCFCYSCWLEFNSQHSIPLQQNVSLKCTFVCIEVLLLFC